VLLLDEPTSSLDVGSAEALGRVVTAEQTRGAAVLLVTHDLGEAATVADRVLVMGAGRVRASDARGGGVAERAERIATLVRDAPAR
jgi:ABC-type sugar transport system ATPase subunit